MLINFVPAVAGLRQTESRQHMTFLKRSDSIVLAAVAALLIIMTPQMAGAGTISIYGIPDHIRHQPYPCIFAGNDGCNKDPAGWPAPTESTTNDWSAATLYRELHGCGLHSVERRCGLRVRPGVGLQHERVAREAADADHRLLWRGRLLVRRHMRSGRSGGSRRRTFTTATGTQTLSSRQVARGRRWPLVQPGFFSCSTYTPFTVPGAANRVQFSFRYTSNLTTETKICT